MKTILKFTLSVCVLALFPAVSVLSDSTAERAEAYIARYSQLAVDEMYRSGVPASITLAQGLLESSYGYSRLASEGNNHFGIKCHSDWEGESMIEDDDNKGECFRKYPDASLSYRDHSDFLRYKARYAFLFDFETTDYKSWAHGLKKAGYATDPQYAAKLIHMIETYDLCRFDSADSIAVVADVEEMAEEANAKEEKETKKQKVKAIPESPRQLESPVRYKGSGHKGSFAVSLSREVLEINGVPFVYAREGETYRTIALQYVLFPKELAGFNESKNPLKRLSAGEVVFLQHKASKAAKGFDKHICQDGDTLEKISQKYAVQLKSLMKMNGFDDRDRILREDDTIYLRGKRPELK